jgi:hypothetical protein
VTPVVLLLNHASIIWRWNLIPVYANNYKEYIKTWIGFLWRRYNFRGKCRARYCDVAKTKCGIRQSNYLPLLLYRISEGEIRRRKKCSEHLKELDRNVGETEVDQTDANPGTDYKDICWQDGRETFHQAQSRKCRARYRDVAKTTSSIRQSNYLPLLLYRIPLINHSWLILFKYFQLNLTFKYTGNLWSTNSDLASHRVLKSWRLIDNFKASNGFPSHHGGKNRYHLEPWSLASKRAFRVLLLELGLPDEDYSRNMFLFMTKNLMEWRKKWLIYCKSRLKLHYPLSV